MVVAWCWLEHRVSKEQDGAPHLVCCPSYLVDTRHPSPHNGTSIVNAIITEDGMREYGVSKSRERGQGRVMTDTYSMTPSCVNDSLGLRWCV